MKGQAQDMGGLAVAIVIAAVAIIVGITVWANVYSAIGNEQFNETLANATGGGVIDTPALANTPIYFGPDSTDGISANATGFYVVDNNTPYVLTLTCCAVTANETFNVTGSGIQVMATHAGAIHIVYTQERVSLATNPTFANINNLTFDAYSLVAVGLIVLAAVAILSLLFVLGRRA